jgi:murein tripeptide amidase MpaA
MIQPNIVEFEGASVNVQSVLRPAYRSVGPVSSSWVRASFEVPDGYTAPRHVDEWLRENCKANWTSVHFHNPRNKDHRHTMVVRFEDRNDALLFKLRDGHKAWEGK